MSAETTTANDNPSTPTQILGDTTKAHASQAMIVQAYALSVLNQPSVDFAGYGNLASLQDSLNGGIARGKDACTDYLNRVLPDAIGTITDIDSYFQLQNALAESLLPGTDTQTAIALLKAVQEQSDDFHARANGVVTNLQGVRSRISANATDFRTYATQLNVVMNGDNGVLSSINDQLGSIDGKIAGAATGVALSALAIAGGVTMIVIGAATELVTGGASTALVIGGVGVLAAGIGGEVGSSVALAKMLDMKNDLLRQQALLSAEVGIATGMASGFNSLSDSAAAAAEATQAMANAWTALGDDLGNLSTMLQKGQTTVPALRMLFTRAAQGDVRIVQSDVATIRGQLVGVRVNADPKRSIAQMVRDSAAEVVKQAA